jgi:hypothetical protein
MDAGLAGLQAALGQAGINLTEDGPQIVASDAMAPPNSQPVEVDPSVSPPAAPQPETATDTGDERMSLDEYAAALTGEDAPEAGVETAATTEATEEPQQTFTERELELQRQLDEYKAKEAQYEVEDKIGAWEDAYDAKLAEGRTYWERTVPQKIQQEAVNRGLSEVEVAQAMVVVKDRQRQWELQLLTEKMQNPALRPEYYQQPALVDQLVTQYGLSADDKAVLQKYAANPDLMKDVAQTIGTRVQMIQQRIETTNQQARTEARQQVAAHLQNGISPAAPNIANAKLPPDFTKVDNRQGAEFFSKMLQSGQLRSRQ